MISRAAEALPVSSGPASPVESGPSVRVTDLGRGFWLGTAALALGGLGQSWLKYGDSDVRGACLLGVAAILGCAAWRHFRGEPSFAVNPGPTQSASAPVSHERRLAGVGASVLLAVGSIVAYRSDPTAFFGLQGSLWLASMGCLLVAATGWRLEGSGPVQGPAWTIWEVLLVIALTALSAFTHLADLERIPWRLHFDEAYAYTEVMRFFVGPPIPLFTTTWENTSLPSLWFFLASGPLHLFGPTLYAVRFPVAMVGVLTTLPLYALARLVWGRLCAALVCWAVAVSACYVHFCRISIINVTTPFLWTTCFCFLLRGLRSRRPVDFVLAGLASGLSQYTYYGTRLLPVVIVTFAAYLAVFHFRAMWGRFRLFGLVAAGFLAGMGPLIGYFVDSPAMWLSRSAGRLSVPLVLPRTMQDLEALVQSLKPLVWSNFLGLGVRGGVDTVWFGPLMLPVEAMLASLGLGVLVWRWRQPGSFLVLLWGLSVIFTGGILIDKDSIPMFAIWTPGFPAFWLALTLPVTLWLRSLYSYKRPWTHALATLVLVALLAADAAANAWCYLVDFPTRVPPDQSTSAVLGRGVESVGPDTDVRILGMSWIDPPMENQVSAMMSAPGTQVRRMFNPSRELPVQQPVPRRLAFLMWVGDFVYLSALRDYYPGGQLRWISTPDGTRMASLYEVSKDTVGRSLGALLTIRVTARPDAIAWQGLVPAAGVLPESERVLEPVEAVWSASLWSQSAGQLRFRLEGLDDVDLWIAGERVLPPASVRVEGGWIPIRLAARLKEPRVGRVYLQRDEAAEFELSPRQQAPWQVDQGLAATIEGSATLHRIDPFLGIARLDAPREDGSRLDPDFQPAAGLGTEAVRIRWEGEIQLPEGASELGLRTDARTRLYLDEVLLLEPDVSSEAGRTGEVRGDGGWHRLRVDYESLPERSNRIELVWRLPPDDWQVVPPSVLRLPATSSARESTAWPALPGSQ